MKTRGRWIPILLVLCFWGGLAALNRRESLQKVESVLEDWLWLARWKLIPNETPSKVCVVTIFSQDLAKLNGGRFEWPNRALMGRLVEKLHEYGARSVGFDMVFGDETKTQGDASLSASLASWPGAIVLGTRFKSADEVKTDSNDDEEGYGFTKETGITCWPILPELLKYAWGRASFNILSENNGDEIPREVPLFYRVDNKPFPGLALGTFLAGSAWTIDQLLISSHSMQAGSGPQIPWRGITPSIYTFWADRLVGPAFCQDYPYRYGSLDLNLFNLLADGKKDYMAERLKDSFVLVGVGDDVFGDTIQLPNQSQRVPGVFVHAALLDALSNPDRFMRRLSGPQWFWLGDVVGLLFCVMVLFVQANRSPLAGFLFLLTVFAVYISGMIGLFCKGFLFSWAVVPFSFFGALLISYYYGFLTEGREKAAIKDMFGKQVSPEIVDELLKHGKDEIFDARRQEISIAFLDVCGFTSFSESHDPKRVLAQLNHYFKFLIPEIMRQRGAVDKIIGDALMITTGVPLYDPDHAYQMVMICMNIRREVEKKNKDLHTGLAPFTFSCGVNSGEVICGNVGSVERMEYTVLGDTVNLAARLQSASKSQEIIVGMRTYLQTKDRIKYEPLPPMHVKGKTETIQAYRVTET